MTQIQRNVRPRRSLLFVPGLRPDRFAKALETGADIVCIDLEDAVNRERKAEARALTMPLFAEHEARGQVEQMLRINGLDTLDGLKDLQALIEVAVPPAAIMIPKVRAVEEIQLLDRLLIGRSGSVRYCVIIETNQGLHRAFDIAQASPRIDCMILGGVDMAADLRCTKAWEPLLYARSRLVHAAASAQIDLLDVPFLNLDDDAGLAQEANACARLGFSGKASIHPKQLAAIHSAFSPDATAIARARKIIAAFEADTTGLVVVDNELIELPVVRSMYRVLAIAERIDRQQARNAA